MIKVVQQAIPLMQPPVQLRMLPFLMALLLSPRLPLVVPGLFHPRILLLLTQLLLCLSLLQVLVQKGVTVRE